MTKTHTTVTIQCPDCGEDNTLARPWELTCHKCNAAISGGRYTKPLITAWTAFALGIGGTLGADYLIGTDRYSIAIEHAIIEACVNESRRPLTYSHIRNKRNVCVCALEKTQSDFDEEAWNDKSQKDKFLKAFEKNAQSCQNE